MILELAELLVLLRFLLVLQCEIGVLIDAVNSGEALDTPVLWHIACIMWVTANHTQTSRELQVDWLSIPISSVLIHVARSCCVAVVYLMMYAFLIKTIWMNVLQCGFHLTMQAAALLADIYFCLDNSSSYLFFFVWTALFQVGGLHCMLFLFISSLCLILMKC